MALDLLAIARDLVAVDTRSSVSDAAAVALLTPLCRDVGLDVVTQSELRDGVKQFNLVATRREGSEAPLLLATHLDTVPPGDHALWTVSGGRPFALTEHDGDLYGLGAADVKLDFLCKLAALDRLRDETFRRPVVLAGTYGEETGRYGAHLLVRRLEPLPAMALVGEPTDLQACPSHKGYVEVHVAGRRSGATACDASPRWRLRFSGVAAHSSQPDRGVSACDLLVDSLPGLRRAGITAVYEAWGGEVMNLVAPVAELVVGAPAAPHVPSAVISPADHEAADWSPALVAALERLHTATAALRRRLAAWTDDAFRPPYSTVNNGRLRLAADHLEYACDTRTLPGDAPREALEDYLQDLPALRVPSVDLRVDTRFAAPPFAARSGSAVLRALRETIADVGLPPTDEIKSGTTEATVYAQAGIDTVVFGPGLATGNIHKPDERVPITHLHAAVDVYEGVVRRLCL